MTESTVRLTGLKKLDMKEMHGTPGVTFEETVLPQGSHGEVALFTAVFAMSALTALAAYLLRKHDNQSFEEVVEIVHADGRKEKRTVKWNSAKSEAPTADVVKQIRGSLY